MTMSDFGIMIISVVPRDSDWQKNEMRISDR